jgi:hypothetical protein
MLELPFAKVVCWSSLEEKEEKGKTLRTRGIYPCQLFLLPTIKNCFPLLAASKTKSQASNTFIWRWSKILIF